MEVVYFTFIPLLLGLKKNKIKIINWNQNKIKKYGKRGYIKISISELLYL